MTEQKSYTISDHTLKVEESGDFYRHNTHPVIRLQGKWLKKAGIMPNSRVRIENPCPGTLIVTLLK